MPQRGIGEAFEGGRPAASPPSPVASGRSSLARSSGIPNQFFDAPLGHGATRHGFRGRRPLARTCPRLISSGVPPGREPGGRALTKGNHRRGNGVPNSVGRGSATRPLPPGSAAVSETSRSSARGGAAKIFPRLPGTLSVLRLLLRTQPRSGEEPHSRTLGQPRDAPVRTHAGVSIRPKPCSRSAGVPPAQDVLRPGAVRAPLLSATPFRGHRQRREGAPPPCVDGQSGRDARAPTASFRLSERRPVPIG